MNVLILLSLTFYLIAVIAAIFFGLYFCHSKFQLLAETRYPLRKTNTVCRQSEGLCVAEDNYRRTAAENV
jgi:hypothetical protein